jgi:hypothetical protein
MSSERSYELKLPNTGKYLSDTSTIHKYITDIIFCFIHVNVFFFRIQNLKFLQANNSDDKNDTRLNFNAMKLKVLMSSAHQNSTKLLMSSEWQRTHPNRHSTHQMLCSADSWTTNTSPVALTCFPKQHENPWHWQHKACPPHITPTRHMPTTAFWGLTGQCLVTIEKNPSFVPSYAFLAHEKILNLL